MISIGEIRLKPENPGWYSLATTSNLLIVLIVLTVLIAKVPSQFYPRGCQCQIVDKQLLLVGASNDNNKIITMKQQVAGIQLQLAKLMHSQDDPPQPHTSHTFLKQTSTSRRPQPSPRTYDYKKSTSFHLDTEVSDVDTSIHSKMETLMNRTRNLEDRLKKQMGTDKAKLTLQSPRHTTDRLLKSFTRAENVKSESEKEDNSNSGLSLVQEQNQTNKYFQKVWTMVMDKPWEKVTVAEDFEVLLGRLAKWQEESEGYRALSSSFSSIFQSQTLTDKEILSIVQSALQSKTQLQQSLSSLSSQVQHLTSSLTHLQQQKSILSQQLSEKETKFNSLDAQVVRLKLNNNCMTEIIYKLQQKKADTDSKVNKEVYNHLQEENNTLKGNLAQIVEENQHLTRALTEEIQIVRESIFDEIRKKILLQHNLVIAETTIQELISNTKLEVSDVKETIKKEMQSRQEENACYKINSPVGGAISQEKSMKYLHEKLKESNAQIRHLEGLKEENNKLANQIEVEKSKLESLSRKEEYEKERLKKQMLEIKKILSEGQQGESAKTLDGEVIVIHQKALEVVYKMKSLKEKNSLIQTEASKQKGEFNHLITEFEALTKRFVGLRVAKNPAGNSEEKLAELEAQNSQLRMQIFTLEDTLKRQLEVVQSLKEENRKNESEKGHEKDTSISLGNPSKTLLSEAKQGVEQSSFAEIKMELEANRSEKHHQRVNSINQSFFMEGEELKPARGKSPLRLKRMKSLSMNSDEDADHDDLPSHPVKFIMHEAFDQKSEISDCWNNTSAIHELAVRIDSQGMLAFKIDELFEKYRIKGAILEVLGSFLKKLDRLQDFQDLLSSTDDLLRFLSGVSGLNNEEDGGLLRPQLAKMEEIFAETQFYLEDAKSTQLSPFGDLFAEWEGEESCSIDVM